jgi:hypothetical protein
MINRRFAKLKVLEVKLDCRKSYRRDIER